MWWETEAHPVERVTRTQAISKEEEENKTKRGNKVPPFASFSKYFLSDGLYKKEMY